jgi:hypothetical protein
VASAQGPASTPSSVFVPGNRVPLSEFVVKSTNAIVLHVDPEVLTWVVNPPGGGGSLPLVAVRSSGGTVQYVNATGWNTNTGTVTLNSSTLMGDCVVVSNQLRHDTAIATHWDPTANGGRGGQAVGTATAYTGGIISMGLDVTMTPPVTHVGTIFSLSSSWYEPTAGPDAGKYTFASDVYALFSDGSGLNDLEVAQVPAFERYIGETYATNSVTPLLAIWLSDQVRERTGFPVAHRSHPFAFSTASQPAGKKVVSELPIFQAVHCHIVDIGNAYDPLDVYPGTENSLATFLLPPGWNSTAPALSYPILFGGQYDINEATFNGIGLGVLEALGTLYQQSNGVRRAVGVLWNGGGAAATYTTQGSSYENAAQLIDYMDSKLHADPERIVFTGGSRGGLAALQLASNPYDKPYTAKFVRAVEPQVLLGEAITYVANPSHSLAVASMGVVTGYSNCWKSGWQEPGTGRTAARLALLNIYGTEDVSVVDGTYANDSIPLRTSLCREGPGVVLLLSTHDYVKPFTQMADYLDHLRTLAHPLTASHPVHTQGEVHAKVYYRFGHSPASNGGAPSDLDLMDKVFSGDTTLPPGIEFFARDSANFTLPVPISPAHVPLTFEAPITVGAGQQHTWAFTGEPGGRFEVWAAKMDATWQLGDDYTGPLQLVFGGRLSAVPGEAFGKAFVTHRFLGEAGYWWFNVRYSPDGDLVFDVTLGKDELTGGAAEEDVVVPGPPLSNLPREPVVLVVSDESAGIGIEQRTGGLSEDGRLVP